MIFGGKIYQLSNVTQAGVTAHEPDLGPGLAWGLLIGAIGVAAFAGSAPKAGFAVILVAAKIIHATLTQPTKYALFLETNAGSSEVLTSTNRAFITKIKLAIFKAMEKERAFNVVFNTHTEQQIHGDLITDNGTVLTRPGSVAIDQG